MTGQQLHALGAGSTALLGLPIATKEKHGIAGNGVPIGVQIVGHRYAEESVFRAGAAVEQLQPWPPLAPLA